MLGDRTITVALIARNEFRAITTTGSRRRCSVTVPIAPELESANDAEAWGSMLLVSFHAMRRCWWLDVAFDEGAPTVNIDAMFGGAYVRGDGRRASYMNTR
jgi:hypothetical protein